MSVATKARDAAALLDRAYREVDEALSECEAWLRDFEPPPPFIDAVADRGFLIVWDGGRLLCMQSKGNPDAKPLHTASIAMRKHALLALAERIEKGDA